MYFNVKRSILLPAIQLIIGAIERKTTNPILSNIFIYTNNNDLRLFATDTEIEISTIIEIERCNDFSLAVPGRKLLDICKALPFEADMKFELNDKSLRIYSGHSRFNLIASVADNYPSMENISKLVSFSVSESVLKKLIDKTSFAMASQDVRYFLNGCLFEFSTPHIKSVATDGHRLALSICEFEDNIEMSQQIILPRKTVAELQRLLSNSSTNVLVNIGERFFRINTSYYQLTSKIIDGRFPEYHKVIPNDCDKHFVINKLDLLHCINRVSILSSDKYRAVKFYLKNNQLVISASNPELELAEEELLVEYEGEDIEIAFKIDYLIDLIQVMDGDYVSFSIKGPNSSCLISDPVNANVSYVLMPMKL